MVLKINYIKLRKTYFSRRMAEVLCWVSSSYCCLWLVCASELHLFQKSAFWHIQLNFVEVVLGSRATAAQEEEPFSRDHNKKKSSFTMMSKELTILNFYVCVF